MEPSPTAVQRALAELERCGLLLQSDAKLASVVSLVAGEPVRGSWWGHRAAHAIYDVCEHLDHHEDAVIAKLVSGKVTYVHRRLWPPLVAVGSAREPWQTEGLSPAAQQFLDAVTQQGELRTDEVPWAGGPKRESPGEAARELERRLLVYSEEFHTATGAHAKRLESWGRWAQRAGLTPIRMTSDQAKRDLEVVLARLNTEFEATARLPWSGG